MKKWPIGAGVYKVSNENIEKDLYLLSLTNDKEYPKSPKEIIFEQQRIYEPDITIKDSIAAYNVKFIKEKMLVPLNRRIIEFNYSTKLGASKNFRRAVALALSRDKISKLTKVTSKPLYELLILGNIWRISITENENIIESKKLFNKELNENYNKVFKIPYTEDNSYFRNSYKIEIKNQLEQAGIKIDFYDNRIAIPLFEVPTVAYYNPKKISSIGTLFGGIIF